MQCHFICFDLYVVFKGRLSKQRIFIFSLYYFSSRHQNQESIKSRKLEIAEVEIAQEAEIAQL